MTGVEGIHGLVANIHSYAQHMQAGVTYVGSQLTARMIRIRGKVCNNVVENRIRLLEALSPLHTGELVLRRGDFARKIGCVVEQAPFFPIENGWDFSILLLCPDPYWSAMEETRIEIAYWEPAFEWELDIPIETQDEGVVFGERTALNIINVHDVGDIETGMRMSWRAIGTVVNPVLIKAQNEDIFYKINTTMLAGDVIDISTDRRHLYARLTRNGVTSNIMGLLDPKSTPDIQVQLRDNVLRFDADVGRTLVDVAIFYTRYYMGV